MLPVNKHLDKKLLLTCTNKMIKTLMRALMTHYTSFHFIHLFSTFQLNDMQIQKMYNCTL